MKRHLIRHSVLQWWEHRGEKALRQSMQGFYGQLAPNTSFLPQAYAPNSIYEDAFIVTPPDRKALIQSFLLIGRFWDIQIVSLERPSIKGERHATKEKMTDTATIHVEYTVSQRLKLLRCLPPSLFQHTYDGYVRLQLQNEASHKNAPIMDNWEILRHEDYIFLPWKSAVPGEEHRTTLTEMTSYTPFFHHFRIAHGKLVHKWAEMQWIYSMNSSPVLGLSSILIELAHHYPYTIYIPYSHWKFSVCRRFPNNCIF